MADLMNKYRPIRFKDVVGQEFQKKILEKHTEAEDFKSSYIFSGPFGSGKCVTGDTLVYLTEKICRFKDLWEELRQKEKIEDIDDGEFIRKEILVHGPFGKPVIAEGVYRQEAQTFTVETEDGFCLSGTSIHKILVLSDGEIKWKKIIQLQKNDIIVLVKDSFDSGDSPKENYTRRLVNALIKLNNRRKKINYEFLLRMNSTSVRVLVCLWMHQKKTNIIECVSEELAKVLQVRSFDSGFKVKRVKNKLEYDFKVFEEINSLIRNGSNIFESSSLLRKMQKSFAKDMVYNLASSFYEFIKSLDQDVFEISFIKKTIRNTMFTREVLKKCVDPLKTYIDRKKPELTNEQIDKYTAILRVMEDDIYFNRVVDVKIDSKKEVFDFTIPKEMAFKSGVFVSHNTTLARIFGRTILCENRNGIEPCNKCHACETQMSGLNRNFVEINAADNNSINDIRKIKESLRYKPADGAKKKIMLFDEAHDLSTEAWDALLKLLEDAPEHIIFMFATTELDKVIPTVRSRSRELKITIPPYADIVKRLEYICSEEKIEYEKDALVLITESVDGHLRDCIKMIATFGETGIVSIDRIRRHLNLDLKPVMIDVLQYAKSSIKDMFENLAKLFDRMDYAETYRRLAEMLVEITAFTFSIQLDGIKILDHKKDRSSMNMILSEYGNNIHRIIEYLFMRSRQGVSKFEIISDIVTLNRILNNEVEFTLKVEAGEKIQRKQDIKLMDEEVDMSDIKEKMKDVGFLYKLGRKRVVREHIETVKEEHFKEFENELFGDQPE